MWRWMALLFGLAVLVGSMTSHRTVYAAQDRQLICHVADDQQSFIIGVAEPAVQAHLENHGDCLINSTDFTLVGEDCDATDANLNDICDIQP